MTDLNPGTCYTEAQLEHMVTVGQNATESQVLTTDTESFHFDYGTTRTVTGGGTLGCGYYQFDLGTTGHGSFAPKPGVAANDVAPVSGFVLFNGPSCAA